MSFDTCDLESEIMVNGSYNFETRGTINLASETDKEISKGKVLRELCPI